MKNSFLHNCISFIVCLFLFIANCNSQYLVNREWSLNTGNPSSINWSSSVINGNNEIITVGNTVVPNEGANVLVSKYSNEGVLEWQQNFNSSNSNNDYGVAVYIDDKNNIYVCGTTDNSSVVNFDVLVLKYTSDGTLEWSQTYNSSFEKNDIGTAITVDDSGNVFIAARSENNSDQDFLTVKFDQFGTLQWDTRYDYLGYYEVPVAIDELNGYIYVAGASGSNYNDWDYTLVEYDGSGNYVDAARNSTPGAGLDLPTSMAKDNLGNFYITGRCSTDGINYNIKTIKLTSSLSVAWTNVFDGFSLDDSANAIAVDTSGNVIVGGYVTNTNNVKQLKIIKYDSSGNSLWSYEQYARIYSKDIQVKALNVGSKNQIYYVADEYTINNTIDISIARLSKEGRIDWEKSILDNNSNEEARSINIDNSGSIFASFLLEASTDSYGLIKFTESEPNNDVMTDSLGEPLYRDHQLIVRFKKSAMNRFSIDNREVEFADLSYYLTSQAKYQVDTALGNLCGNYGCAIKASKVFPQLYTVDTSTVNRLGEIIPIPDFWTTLLLEFDSSLDILQIFDIFSRQSNIISYSEPNLLVSTASLSCTDPLYAIAQTSLHAGPTPYSSAHINVEPAWNIQNPEGASIKCGVCDEGVDWQHEDFGYDGNHPNTSSLVDGWDFEHSRHTKKAKVAFAKHGTNTAGVIGAVRNNDLGISGIAGRDECTSSPGISLYSLDIFRDDKMGDFLYADLKYIYNAIVVSSTYDTTKDYGWGLNIINCSWRYDETKGFAAYYNVANNNLMIEATHYANRAQVVFCASRGNEGRSNIAYPAVIDEDWILCVGGTGWDGCYSTTSNGQAALSYGSEVDVAAPAALEVVMSLKADGGYERYNGTSSAAPHVSGVVGLMLQYWNSPLASYSNLAPEDCERILELSTTKRTGCGQYSTYPNVYVGWGLLNAGNALELIERPTHDVKHFGTTTNSGMLLEYDDLDSSPLIVTTNENYTNDAGKTFDAGTYHMKRYKVSATIDHTLASSDKLFAYWARSSSSAVLESVKPLVANVTWKLRPRQRARISSCSTTTCEMDGFVYQVFDTNNALLGWWPFDILDYQTKAKFEYTILTNNVTETKELASGLKISIFPNPSSTSQTISFENKNLDFVEINIYDLLGNKVQQVYKSSQTNEKFEVEAVVENLISGLYTYEIKIGEHLYYQKVIISE